MYNKKLHLLLYSLLFIYILISLGQYFHFKNEINKRTKRIENLNTLISKNDVKVEQVKNIKESYEVLELYLDSTLIRTKKTQKKTKSKTIKTNTSIKDLTVNSSLENKKENSPTNTKITTTDSTIVGIQTPDTTNNNLPEKEIIVNKPKKPSTEELRDQLAEIRSYFFKEITHVYSNAKNPKPIKSNDRNIWIEIESENGNYKNSLKDIIHYVTLNDVNLIINDIKENIRKTPSGFISTYYIQVKVPKGLLYQRNQLIVTADKDYIKLFLVAN